MRKISIFLRNNQTFCTHIHIFLEESFVNSDFLSNFVPIQTNNRTNMRKLTTLLLLAASLTATAQNHVLDINTQKLGAPVQPTMYGIFFEDINYAADGGLYAEMVKNRSFEFPQHLMGWRAFGNFDVKEDLSSVILTMYASNTLATAISSQVSRMKVSSVSPSKREPPIVSPFGHVVLKVASLPSRSVSWIMTQWATTSVS